MTLSLQNKKIIISAGASGIGWATTKVCLTPATVEVVDKSGFTKGYITEEELSVALTKSKADVLTKSKT